MVKVSDAELEVLNVIWDKKETTSDVIIKEVKEFNWSPNTVRTLIKRLMDKGAIEAKKEGKHYLYTPIYDREEYKKQEAKKLLEKLYNGSAKEMVMHLYKAGDISYKDLESIINK